MAYRYDGYDQSIVIDGWENGIADSPYLGISNMRNVIINSIPGETSVNYGTVIASFPSLTGAVTGASDFEDTIFITSSTTISDGMSMTFAGASLPTGVAAGTKYLIRVFSSAGTTYHISIYLTYANYLLGPTLGYQAIGSNSGTGTYTTVNMGNPINRFYDKATSTAYIIDSNGRVWQPIVGGWIYLLGNDTTTTTSASGNGIIAYRGYLFAFRNALIDYMKQSDGAWTYAWQTMNTASGTSNSHYAHFGQDDVAYYCDGAYIGSFFKKKNGPPDTITFDPTDATTYTWNKQALTLPSLDIAQCLTELGVNLLVGGQLNAIYPWNRTAIDFSYPILLAENFIQRMVTVNTNTYILAGQRGRIYITNGSQALVWREVPDHISGTVEPTFQWGDLAFDRNQLYFSCTCRANTSGASITLAEYGGLWAIDLDTKAIRLINRLSYGTYNGLAGVIIPTPLVTGSPPYLVDPLGLNLYIGWTSGGDTPTYGVDKYDGNPYTGSQATIDTDLIPIGTYEHPRDLTRIEYKLTKALVTGESITIQYRLLFDTTGASSGAGQYITVLTDSTAGNYSLSGPVNFKNAQWVQFKIILNSTNTTPSYVRLKQIRITGIVGQLSS